jgi:hypothetical protein
MGPAAARAAKSKVRVVLEIILLNKEGYMIKNDISNGPKKKG